MRFHEALPLLQRNHMKITFKIIQYSTTLLVRSKVFDLVPVLSSPSSVPGQVRVLLLHPHTWVRLTASQLYGLLFAGYTPEELVTMATQDKNGCGDARGGGKSKKKRKSSQQKVVHEYIQQDTITKVTWWFND